MSDLSEVKKILISLINLYPKGRAADKFNADYRESEGKAIPFAEYSYVSLLQFLDAELKDNIRIENRGMDICLFPIANTRSGHVLTLTRESKNIPGVSR